MVALKREWAIKSGGFDERLSSLEDHEFDKTRSTRSEFSQH